MVMLCKSLIWAPFNGRVDDFLQNHQLKIFHLLSVSGLYELCRVLKLKTLIYLKVDL